MPPKPKDPFDKLHAWVLKRVRRIMWVSGVVAAISGGIVGGAKAWPLVEPYFLAHRGYVRDYTTQISDKANAGQEDSRRVIRDLQIEQAEGKRDQADDSLLKWRVELGKASDAQTVQLIAKQITTLETMKSKLVNQIQTLNAVRDQ